MRERPEIQCVKGETSQVLNTGNRLIFKKKKKTTLLFVFQDDLWTKWAHHPHAVMEMLNLEKNEGQSPKHLGQGCCCIGPRSHPYLVAGAKFSPIG